MSSNNATQTSKQVSEAADLEKAFQELARGEQTATALENQLNVMEAKIEALLAQAEKEQLEVSSIRGSKSSKDGSSK